MRKFAVTLSVTFAVTLSVTLARSQSTRVFSPSSNPSPSTSPHHRNIIEYKTFDDPSPSLSPSPSSIPQSVSQPVSQPIPHSKAVQTPYPGDSNINIPIVQPK